MGIHYDYKSTRGAKAMEKQAKREKKLAEKRAKKQAKSGHDYDCTACYLKERRRARRDG